MVLLSLRSVYDTHAHGCAILGYWCPAQASHVQVSDTMAWQCLLPRAHCSKYPAAIGDQHGGFRQTTEMCYLAAGHLYTFDGPDEVSVRFRQAREHLRPLQTRRIRPARVVSRTAALAENSIYWRPLARQVVM